jgi:tetratricopeptide (TPR) repeat protein/S1-C subfamily serine protease
MKRNLFAWRPPLFGAALLTAFLLSAARGRGQGAEPAKAGGEPPLPVKKTADEDPPLPSKKAGAARPARVEVKVPSAEVKAGDKVVATVLRGQVLPFTKKTDDYYLVTVDGKKGWIKRDEVREVEAAGGGTAEPLPGSAPAVIGAETTRKVKEATCFLRVRLVNGNTLEGSGFFGAEPGLVLTNAHVLGMRAPGSAPPAQVSVVVHSGEPEEFTLQAKVLGVDRENDLGVLRVTAAPGRPLPAPLPVEGTRVLGLVQKVYIFGFPFGASLGKNITVSESSVSSIRKDADGVATQVQVNGGMHPGNSGGPVVDSRGVVVGVAVAVIRGTQINFAVPGERVQEVLRGRAAQTQLCEAFLDQGQVKVPVRISFLDPLERIHTVKLQVWAGKASAGRPASLHPPKPLPGDAPRQDLAVTYANGAAQVDAPVPALADGQVFWIQPVLTDQGGATHWGRGVAYTPSGLPPLERTAAVLRQDFEKQPERTIKLVGKFQVRAFKGASEFLLQDFMELEALEACKPHPRGGLFHLFLGAHKATTEANGKTQPLFPRAQALLRGRNMTFITDRSGALLQRTVPVLNPPNPLDLRLDYAELVDQIANTYEMMCLSIPDRELQPHDTWRARVPVFLTNPLPGQQARKQSADLLLTCTYEGRRLHRGQPQAVISLSGTLRRSTPGEQSTSPLVAGKVHFALDEGFVSLAQLRVESEGGEGGITLAHAVELSLTRVAGNTAGIVATPVAPVPGGPVAKGRVLLQSVLALTVNDPVNCPGKQGCFYKVQSVEFAAGRTYVIEMDKVGASNLDPYLILVGPGGQVVAQDDDSGGSLNARIVYKAPAAGRYRIFATTFAPRMIGTFRLAVSEEAGAAAPVGGGDYELAQAFFQKRDFDRAIPYLEKAVAANPSFGKAYSDLGFAYNEKRLYDKAIPCFKKVIELEPNQVAAHNNLGAAYNGKGQYDEAISALKKAVALAPNHVPAHNNLGFAFNAKGWHEDGIASLKKAVQLQPKNAVAWNNLATALGEVGDLKGARDALQKVLALTPNTAPGYRTVNKRLEQTEALLGLAQRVGEIEKGELKPKDFQEALQFGKLCRVTQHYTAALRLYDQALAGEPEAAKKRSPTDLAVLARTALLAAEATGSDPPPESDRPKYRAKALAWLRSYLKAQEEALAKDASANRYFCQQNLRGLLQHKGLASVRPPALGNLPADEREE